MANYMCIRTSARQPFRAAIHLHLLWSIRLYILGLNAMRARDIRLTVLDDCPEAKKLWRGIRDQTNAEEVIRKLWATTTTFSRVGLIGWMGNRVRTQCVCVSAFGSKAEEGVEAIVELENGFHNVSRWTTKMLFALTILAPYRRIELMLRVPYINNNYIHVWFQSS